MAKKKKKEKSDIPGPFNPRAPVLHLKPKQIKIRNSGKYRPHQGRR